MQLEVRKRNWLYMMLKSWRVFSNLLVFSLWTRSVSRRDLYLEVQLQVCISAWRSFHFCSSDKQMYYNWSTTSGSAIISLYASRSIHKVSENKCYAFIYKSSFLQFRKYIKKISLYWNNNTSILEEQRIQFVWEYHLLPVSHGCPILSPPEEKGVHVGTCLT